MTETRGIERFSGEPFALMALATGATVASAARRAGIGESTLRRRLANPEYRRRITETRDEIMARIVGRFVNIQTIAVDTMHHLMMNAKSEATRLSAACATLNFALKYRDAIDVQRRIADLEAESTGADDDLEAAEKQFRDLLAEHKKNREGGP